MVFFHLGWLVWREPGNISAASSDFHGWTPANVGWIGVEIFFALSGFVIAFSAERSTAWSFARSRIVRLYPGVWISASLCAVLSLITSTAAWPQVLGEWARSVIIWPFGGWISGVYWTLPIEIAFYTLIFALVLIRRYKNVEWLFMGLSVYSFAFFAISAMTDGAMGETAERLSLLRFGCHFALGGFIWMWSRGGFKWRHVPFLGMAVVACLREISWMAAGKAVGNPLAHACLAAAVWAVAIVAIVLAVAFNGSVAKFWSTGATRTIGLATYPLYLTHDVVGRYVLQISNLAPQLRVLTAVIVACAVAFIISIALEPGLQRALRIWLDKLAIMARAHF